MDQGTFLSLKPAGKGVVARVMCPAVGQRESQVLEQELRTAATPAAGRVALDMSSVTVLGSMGLGVLVTITKVCKEAGGKLTIFGLSPELTELVRLTKLDKFLSIAKSERDASSALG